MIGWIISCQANSEAALSFSDRPNDGSESMTTDSDDSFSNDRIQHRTRTIMENDMHDIADFFLHDQLL